MLLNEPTDKAARWSWFLNNENVMGNLQVVSGGVSGSLQGRVSRSYEANADSVLAMGSCSI